MIPFNSDIFPKTEKAYVIGGSVRDVFLERNPTDYDIAVEGNPEEFAKKITSNTTGHIVEMGRPGQKVVRVVLGDAIIDITSLSGIDIEADLKKRDFTINAMAYDLSSGKVIDCLGGLQDLADKKIRMVSKEVFRKDPIRLLRAYRMSASLEFEIEQHTVDAIKAEAPLITDSAGERIRAEWFKILDTSKSYFYLSQMDGTGLLSSIFPDLKRLKGCVQNRHHHYDVFEHTMKAYHCLEMIISDLSHFFPDTAMLIHNHIDKSKTALLKCAILLHDIGKPSVKTIDKRDIIHFYAHPENSAGTARKIGQRLKFATRETNFIDFIIRNHMRPLFLFKAQQKKTLKRKGLTRFFIKCGDDTPYLLLHTIADIISKRYSVTKKNEVFISFIENVMNDFFNKFKPKSKEPPLITGYDLIHVFGLTPSPLFKTILYRVEEARLANGIQSRGDALNFVREFIKNP